MRIPPVLPRLALGVCLAAGCVGFVEAVPDGRGPAAPSVPAGQSPARTPAPDPLNPGTPSLTGAAPLLGLKSGARRLSRDEYANTIRDLLGDANRPTLSYLPEDTFTPFDNEYPLQDVSQSLVEGTERMAEELAGRAVLDPVARDRLVGCSPSGPADETCLRAFVTRFGRRALRRPLSAQEVTDYLTLQTHAVAPGDFYATVALIIRAMLQDPEFLYRVEVGTPEPGRPGLFRLSQFEVASRLSYMLWGGPPGDALLDTAAAGKLGTSDAIRAAAATLLADRRAIGRVQRFHAMWLGYHQLPHPPALSNNLRAETDALVERVVFTDKRPWLDLFRSTETYISDVLATHYGLPPTGSTTPRWVPYGQSGRKGILSHGAFLSVNGKFGDTSPTQRGLLIRQRLACQDIPPPPPAVDADKPPPGEPGSCKADRYRSHAANPMCAGCHGQIDPVGFGLEAYDVQGRFRTQEVDKPKCAIKGEGELLPFGKFTGPAELGDRLVESGVMEGCLVRRVFRAAVGRPEESAEGPFLTRLTDELRRTGGRLDSLLLTLAADRAFVYRLED